MSTRPAKTERHQNTDAIWPVTWNDTGCNESPKCVDCGLPQCKFEDGIAYVVWKRQQRDIAIAASHAAGASVEALCASYGLSPRAIKRAIASGKGAA